MESLRHHPISLAQALAISDNIFAVKTLEEVGYKNYQSMANGLASMRHSLDVPAIALGTSEVTLSDMTNAFSRIAAGGLNIEPTTIISITDAEGKTVYEKPTKKVKHVISEQDAFVLTHLINWDVRSCLQ